MTRMPVRGRTVESGLRDGPRAVAMRSRPRRMTTTPRRADNGTMSPWLAAILQPILGFRLAQQVARPGFGGYHRPFNRPPSRLSDTPVM